MFLAPLIGHQPFNDGHKYLCLLYICAAVASLSTLNHSILPEYIWFQYKKLKSEEITLTLLVDNSGIFKRMLDLRGFFFFNSTTD